jgi:predicted nicotinamide N-methyase
LALSPAPTDPIGSDHGWDVILIGDAFYEKPLADRLLPWIDALAARGATILLGDPGRSYFPKNRFTLLASYQVPVTRALEDAEIKATNVWRV